VLTPAQAAAARARIARERIRDAAYARFERTPEPWASLILLGLALVVLPWVFATGEC
jgi:hypothetical protein